MQKSSASEFWNANRIRKLFQRAWDGDQFAYDTLKKLIENDPHIEKIIERCYIKKQKQIAIRKKYPKRKKREPQTKYTATGKSYQGGAPGLGKK